MSALEKLNKLEAFGGTHESKKSKKKKKKHEDEGDRPFKMKENSSTKPPKETLLSARAKKQLTPINNDIQTLSKDNPPISRIPSPSTSIRKKNHVVLVPNSQPLQKEVKISQGERISDTPTAVVESKVKNPIIQAPDSQIIKKYIFLYLFSYRNRENSPKAPNSQKVVINLLEESSEEELITSSGSRSSRDKESSPKEPCTSTSVISDSQDYEEVSVEPKSQEPSPLQEENAFTNSPELLSPVERSPQIQITKEKKGNSSKKKYSSKSLERWLVD